MYIDQYFLAKWDFFTQSIHNNDPYKRALSIYLSLIVENHYYIRCSPYICMRFDLLADMLSKRLQERQLWKLTKS
jgi:hypothetical protein